MPNHQPSYTPSHTPNAMPNAQSTPDQVFTMAFDLAFKKYTNQGLKSLKNFEKLFSDPAFHQTVEQDIKDNLEITINDWKKQNHIPQIDFRQHIDPLITSRLNHTIDNYARKELIRYQNLKTQAKMMAQKWFELSGVDANRKTDIQKMEEMIANFPEKTLKNIVTSPTKMQDIFVDEAKKQGLAPFSATAFTPQGVGKTRAEIENDLAIDISLLSADNQTLLMDELNTYAATGKASAKMIRLAMQAMDKNDPAYAQKSIDFLQEFLPIITVEKLQQMGLLDENTIQAAFVHMCREYRRGLPT